jgi:predicted outer membrane repeat protein
MRQILCALLLLLAPALAPAAPTISAITPLDLGFTNGKTVHATVTGNGALTVTVSVNGSVPAAASVPDPNSPNRYEATDLPFVTENDPNGVLVVGNSVIAISATDLDGTTDATVTVTFDDQAPVVSAVEIVTPPLLDPNGTTGFASLRIEGTMTDNDPNFAPQVVVRGSASTLPLETDGSFSRRIVLAGGANTILPRAIDRAGNRTEADTMTITRTQVCDDPNFPLPLSDPNASVTYVVDRNDDLPDPVPNDGKCDVRPDLRPDPDPSDPNVPFTPRMGHCTLRAAIQTANAHPGDDRIQLNSRIITLTRTGADQIGDPDPAAQGDLDVTDNLRIFGGGRDVAVIDAKKLGDRVFDVAPGVELQLLRLTASNGRTPKPAAGTDPESGGCVRSRGTLKTNFVALLSCKSLAAGGTIAVEGGSETKLTCSILARGQAKTNGGGISLQDSPLELRNSTLSLNSAGGSGGAISMAGDGDPLDAILSNVTLSQNKARVAGGALDLGASVSGSVNNCTFANNSARAGASISTTSDGNVEISNSILGDKSKLACDPTSPQPVVSLGGNVDRGTSCISLATNGDQPASDPKLGKLATNSGPPTHAPAVDSPAVDHGGTGSVACEPLDARGAERGDWPRAGSDAPSYPTYPDHCDAGALELAVVPAP